MMLVSGDRWGLVSFICDELRERRLRLSEMLTQVHKIGACEQKGQPLYAGSIGYTYLNAEACRPAVGWQALF